MTSHIFKNNNKAILHSGVAKKRKSVQYFQVWLFGTSYFHFLKVLIFRNGSFLNYGGDDNDVDEGDDELFLQYGWPTKGVKHYFQPGPLSEILIIANLWHAACRIWAFAKSKFRLWWMNLCSSDNNYIAAPQRVLWEFQQISLQLYMLLLQSIPMTVFLFSRCSWNLTLPKTRTTLKRACIKSLLYITSITIKTMCVIILIQNDSY